ncbi:MAG: hypothetical protein VB142_03030 [Burkholderia sp.]
MHSKLFETALGINDLWFVNGIDFVAGSRSPHPEIASDHPVHDTVVKCYQHLNFFRHDCFLKVRTPRIKLPDGRVALAKIDLSDRINIAVDETFYQCGHNYLTLVADAFECKVVFMTESKDATTDRSVHR